jgi:quinol monooxygenase YgiN
MISVIAKLVVQDGKTEEILAAFKTLLPQVANEKGTLLYSLNTNPNDPNAIVVIERYVDKAALNEHSSTPHFKAFSKTLGAVLAAKPEITILQEIDVVMQ